MAEDGEMSDGSNWNEITERASHTSNSNGRTGYLNPNTKKAFT